MKFERQPRGHREESHSPSARWSPERTGLPRRAAAVEGADAVNAGGPVEAGGAGAVVDVHRAVRAGPAVHADAGETADGVGAGRPVLAKRWPACERETVRRVRGRPDSDKQKKIRCGR